MATVFRATDLKHGRAVAIKVLRPELAFVVGADRFAREIRTTATLRHPHILPLFDSGEANGALFYVMPVVDGESLRDRLNREKRLPIDDALRIAREVADALGYAHERGIAHRDIKPENILLERGHAVVADFGIARVLASSDDSRITQTGLAVGTPAYMSPEQAVGETTVDGRSDLYSLACVLYEMLAGVPPFSGATAASVTSQHLVAEPPAVTDARPETPVAVSGAIRLAMAKDPAARPYPAARFVESLSSAESAAASSPSLARQRMPRVTATRVAIGSVSIVAALAVGWQFSRRTSGASPIRRIAVLPMANETGDSTQQFFADGMTREVISTLTDAGVHVLGYRAVVPYRASTKPLPDIARELGVDAIVSGSIVKAGTVVRLSAELIDATNEELWTRSFERPAADVIALQRDVAADIARGIRVRLTPEQETALSTARQVDPRAYAEFLLGQEAASLRTAEGFQRSVTHLHRSLAIDSTYAPAWATLAITNAYALIYQTTSRDSAFANAMRAADRAIALDPRQGDAYYARGMVRLHNAWEFGPAYADFAHADSLPSSSLGLGVLGWAMWEMHDFDAMANPSTRLIDLEPSTAQWRSDRAWGLWSSGQDSAALESARIGTRLDSTFYEVFDILSLVLADVGDSAGARREHERARRIAGGDYWVRTFNDGLLANARGDRAGLARAIHSLEGDPRVSQLGGLLLLAGDKDRAYATLNRAVAARDLDLLQILNAMPALYPFRQEPRFQALLARMGMPERLRK